MVTIAAAEPSSFDGLWGAFSELKCFWTHFLLRFVKWQHDSSLKLNKPVVLLLHGSHSNASDLLPLAHGLRQLETPALLQAITYGQGMSDEDALSDGVRKLHEKLMEIAREHPAAMVPVLLVGHSLGAILSVYYSRCCQPPPGVEILGCASISGRLKDTPSRLRPYFYESLAPHLAAIQGAEGPPILGIAGSNDWLVPMEALKRDIVIPGTSHLSVLDDPRTWEHLHEWIKEITQSKAVANF